MRYEADGDLFECHPSRLRQVLYPFANNRGPWLHRARYGFSSAFKLLRNGRSNRAEILAV